MPPKAQKKIKTIRAFNNVAHSLRVKLARLQLHNATKIE